MLFSLNIVAGCSAAECRVVPLWPTKRRAVPSAPGVATDTSPPNGCRIATKVAIWELAENPVACEKPLYLEHRAASFGSRMGTC